MTIDSGLGVLAVVASDASISGANPPLPAAAGIPELDDSRWEESPNILFFGRTFDRRPLPHNLRGNETQGPQSW